MMKRHRIGETARRLGVSVDTLRYYERIGLLPRVARTGAGVRTFSERDVSRLRFIRRAQAMDFTLDEIAALLRLRDRPARSRSTVRRIAREKLRAIDERIEALAALRDDLRALVNDCPGTGSECPILAGIERRSRAGVD